MKFTLILIALLVSTALALPIQISEEDIKCKFRLERYLEKFTAFESNPGRKMRKRYNQPTQAQIDEFKNLAGGPGKRDVEENIDQPNPENEWDGSPGKRDVGKSDGRTTDFYGFGGPGKRDVVEDIDQTAPGYVYSGPGKRDVDQTAKGYVYRGPGKRDAGES
ncbi:3635_t:CDS:2 [Funneliformis mosseae]|uniref:3635_t:CDS:1 n=1 Tax=Funneliformis mosseae TaxID=27381 RepID=A0A9N8VQX0_FUNMO|nr:3635_t:CDS:2 [Funneliformis mosseae]